MDLFIYSLSSLCYLSNNIYLLSINYVCIHYLSSVTYLSIKLWTIYHLSCIYPSNYQLSIYHFLIIYHPSTYLPTHLSTDQTLHEATLWPRLNNTRRPPPSLIASAHHKLGTCPEREVPDSAPGWPACHCFLSDGGSLFGPPRDKKDWHPQAQNTPTCQPHFQLFALFPNHPTTLSSYQRSFRLPSCCDTHGHEVG